MWGVMQNPIPMQSLLKVCLCSAHKQPRNTQTCTQTQTQSLPLSRSPFHTYKHTWHMGIHNRVPLWTVAMQHFSDWVSWALVHVHSQTHTPAGLWVSDHTHNPLPHPSSSSSPTGHSCTSKAKDGVRRNTGRSRRREALCGALLLRVIAFLDEILGDVWWFFNLNCGFIYKDAYSTFFCSLSSALKC